MPPLWPLCSSASCTARVIQSVWQHGLATITVNASINLAVENGAHSSPGARRHRGAQAPRSVGGGGLRAAGCVNYIEVCLRRVLCQPFAGRPPVTHNLLNRSPPRTLQPLVPPPSGRTGCLARTSAPHPPSPWPPGTAQTSACLVGGGAATTLWCGMRMAGGGQQWGSCRAGVKGEGHPHVPSEQASRAPGKSALQAATSAW